MNNNADDDVGHWSSVADSNESPVESGFQENTNAFATISIFDLEEFLSEIGEDDTEREKVENEFAKKLVLYERNVNPDRMIFNINGMIDHWENDDGFLFSYRTELEKLHSHFKFNLEQIWLDRRSPLGREKSTYMTNLFRFGNKILNVLCAPRHLRYSPQRETLLSKCDILFDKIRNCMSKTKNGVDEYIVLGEYITEDILAVITSISLFYSNGSKEVEQIFRCVLSIARNFPVFRQHLLMNLFRANVIDKTRLSHLLSYSYKHGQIIDIIAERIGEYCWRSDMLRDGAPIDISKLCKQAKRKKLMVRHYEKVEHNPPLAESLLETKTSDESIKEKQEKQNETDEPCSSGVHKTSLVPNSGVVRSWWEKPVGGTDYDNRVKILQQSLLARQISS